MNNEENADHIWGIEDRQDYVRISLQTIGRKSSTSVGSFSLEERHEKKEKSYLAHLSLVAHGHGDEYPAEARIERMLGDEEGGEEQCSSL